MKHFVVTNISAILVRTSRDDIPCNEKRKKKTGGKSLRDKQQHIYTSKNTAVWLRTHMRNI